MAEKTPLDVKNPVERSEQFRAFFSNYWQYRIGRGEGILS